MSAQVQSITIHNPIRWFMAGAATTLVALALVAGLALAILLPATQPGELISVELWPTPVTQTLGFLGCDLSAVTATRPGSP